MASCTCFHVNKIPGDGHPYLGLTGSLLKEYAVEAAKKESLTRQKTTQSRRVPF